MVRHKIGESRRKTAAESAGPSKIIGLKITLLGIDPPIWRRFSVPSEITLARLHDVIQIVMGWFDSHLHQFIDRQDTLYSSGFLLDDDPEVIDGKDVPLRRIVEGPGSALLYQYDFGDGWEHRLEIQSIEDPEPGVSYPLCVEGNRACPPEDCGGTWGYEELLEILGDPTHEEYAERLEWVADNYDPERFDLDEVNERLAHVAQQS